MKTKAEAFARARQVKAMMKTRGWKIRVHQNLDWHWNLTHADGHFCLYENDAGKFSILMSGGDYAGTGSYDWKDAGNYGDPNAAVSGRLRLAINYARRVTGWVWKVQALVRG